MPDWIVPRAAYWLVEATVSAREVVEAVLVAAQGQIQPGSALGATMGQDEPLAFRISNSHQQPPLFDRLHSRFGRPKIGTARSGKARNSKVRSESTSALPGSRHSRTTSNRPQPITPAWRIETPVGTVSAPSLAGCTTSKRNDNLVLQTADCTWGSEKPVLVAGIGD